MVSGWTGQTACALQKAMGLSNEAFAKRLGIAVRTVAGWHEKATLRPQSAMQEILDTALEQASPAVKARFGEHGDAPTPAADLSEAQRRLAADPGIIAALDWLDRHTSWEPGTARREVAARLAKIDVRRLQDRGTRRGDVNQRRLADALASTTRTGRTGTACTPSARQRPAC